MTENFSFQDNIDFYNEISCFSERNVVASVKTYENTGTYINLRLSRKDSEDFRFNHRITLSAAELDLLGQKIKTMQDLSSRRTAKKNKPKQRTGCESDLEESTKVEERNNHDKKLQIKQVKVTKKINKQNGGAMVERTPEFFLSVCQTTSLLCMSK